MLSGNNGKTNLPFAAICMDSRMMIMLNYVHGNVIRMPFTFVANVSSNMVHIMPYLALW